jgi:hypothetical protein
MAEHQYSTRVSLEILAYDLNVQGNDKASDRHTPDAANQKFRPQAVTLMIEIGCSSAIH